MKTSILTAVVMMINAGSAFAATPEEVLRTAWKDQDLTSYSEAVGILSQAQPWNPFSEFQLTYELGDIQKNSQKYGFRIYPKGLTEFTAYRGFLGALEADEKGLQQEALSQTLVKRYNLLARLAFLKSKNQSSRDLSTLAEKAGRALAYNARTNRSELKNYLKAKSDLEKVYLKLAELDRDLAIAEQDLKGLAVTDAKNLDFSDLATPAEIRERISRFDQARPSLSAKKARLDYDRSLAALHYDQAQENKWLNHFEVSVKDDKQERFYGVEVGFKMPFLSSPDLGSIDKQARLARAKAEANSSASTANQTLFASVAELKALLNLHQNLKERQSQNNPAALRKASDLVARQDPMLAVELQRGWYESFEQLAEIELQIRTLYIQYLHETSTLTDEPEINHLSKTLKRIR